MEKYYIFLPQNFNGLLLTWSIIVANTVDITLSCRRCDLVRKSRSGDLSMPCTLFVGGHCRGRSRHVFAPRTPSLDVGACNRKDVVFASSIISLWWSPSEIDMHRAVERHRSVTISCGGSDRNDCIFSGELCRILW